MDDANAKKSATGNETVATKPPKLPWSAHLMCGWPLFLIVVGGAIGGGLGGAAYGLNTVVYRSNLPVPVKVVTNIAIGLAAIGIWLGIATLIQSRLK